MLFGCGGDEAEYSSQSRVWSLNDKLILNYNEEG